MKTRPDVIILAPGTRSWHWRIDALKENEGSTKLAEGEETTFIGAALKAEDSFYRIIESIEEQQNEKENPKTEERTS